MTASTRARMSASTIHRKLKRVDERLASGDYRLRPFRRSLVQQLRAIERKERKRALSGGDR